MPINKGLGTDRACAIHVHGLKWEVFVITRDERYSRALVSHCLKRCIENSMDNMLTDVRVLRAHRIEGTLPGSVVRTY